MSVLLTGRGIQWRGAGPRGEPIAIGETADVTNVGKYPGGHDRSDTVEIHQSRAAGEHDRLELGGGLLDLGFDGDQLDELFWSTETN